MNRQRIDFVDVARAYAIALVTFGHAMGEFGAWDELSESTRELARLVTRTGTPLFVLMFGMMIELIHVRRAQHDGVDALRPRLRRRALECYAGYLLVSAAALVSDRAELLDVAESAVLLGGAGYGTILGVYALALAATPALLRIRIRFGAWAAPALLALLWSLDAFVLARFDDRDAGAFAYPIDFVLGAGRHIRGPSLLHSFTFVLAGMILAGGLRTWQERGAKDFGRRVAAVSAVAGIVVLGLMWRDGTDAVIDGFRYYRGYRRDNAAGYFALGVIGASLTLLLLAVSVPRRGLPRWTDIPMQLGRSSLLAFTLGSAGLTVLDLDQRRAIGEHGIAAAVAAVLLLMLAVNWRRLLPAPPSPSAPTAQGTSTALPTKRWSSRSPSASPTRSNA